MSGRYIGNDEKAIGVLEVSVDEDGVFAVALPKVYLRGRLLKLTISSEQSIPR